MPSLFNIEIESRVFKLRPCDHLLYVPALKCKGNHGSDKFNCKLLALIILSNPKTSVGTILWDLSQLQHVPADNLAGRFFTDDSRKAQAGACRFKI